MGSPPRAHRQLCPLLFFFCLLSPQAHDQAVKQVMDDLRAALADAVSRRNEACAAAKSMEDDIVARFAEASRLEGRLRDVSSSKADTEANLAQLQVELAQAKADLEQANSNEKAADAEIDKANSMLMQLEQEIEARDARIAELEEAAADAAAINKGLEDDKDEIAASVKALRSEIEAANVRVGGLAGERDRLAGELSHAQRRVAELEKAADLGEVGIAKLRSERESAVEARASALAELERVRAKLEATEASVANNMAHFNRTQELQFSREREVAQQVGGLTDKLNTACAERDDLRAAKAQLLADVREHSASEARLSADLAQAQANAADLARKLDASRAECAKASADLAEVRATLDKAVAESSAARADLEQKLAVATGKLAEATDKLRAAAESEGQWREKETAWTCERAALASDKSRAEESNATLSKEIETLKEAYGASEESKEVKLCEANKANVLLKRKLAEMRQMEMEKAEAIARATRLQEALFSSEMSRRALHNTVQELKGNIRVYVRVRPFLPADADPAAARALAGITDDDAEAEFVPDPTAAIAVSPDGTALEMMPPAPRGIKDGFLGVAKRETKPVRFGFDQVFGQRTTQEDIFNEVSNLVQSGGFQRL
jgi:chromosome segregation ATPase